MSGFVDSSCCIQGRGGGHTAALGLLKTLAASPEGTAALEKVRGSACKSHEYAAAWPKSKILRISISVAMLQKRS